MTYDERTSEEGTATNKKSVEQTMNEMPQLQEEHSRGREDRFHSLPEKTKAMLPVAP